MGWTLWSNLGSGQQQDSFNDGGMEIWGTALSCQDLQLSAMTGSSTWAYWFNGWLSGKFYLFFHFSISTKGPRLTVKNKSYMDQYNWYDPRNLYSTARNQAAKLLGHLSIPSVDGVCNLGQAWRNGGWIIFCRVVPLLTNRLFRRKKMPIFSPFATRGRMETWMFKLSESVSWWLRSSIFWPFLNIIARLFEPHETANQQASFTKTLIDIVSKVRFAVTKNDKVVRWNSLQSVFKDRENTLSSDVRISSVSVTVMTDLNSK